MELFNKDEIKNSLTLEQVEYLLAHLGASPQRHDDILISQTICHNHPGEGSHKLYYYNNTKLFKCYTHCNDTFDIFDLIKRHMNIMDTSKKWRLYDSIKYVANFFGLDVNFNNIKDRDELADWSLFDKFHEEKEKTYNDKAIFDINSFDDKIIKFYPQPIIEPWEKEGITYEIMKSRNIHFDPVNYGIIIPHYNINNELVGIRERTCIIDNEKYGKYLPAILGGKMYNHPLGMNLYNINNSKENIKKFKIAIIYEGEKSCLLHASIFGKENDISVACCGSNITNYQVSLLLGLGVQEIIVGFDKQFKVIGDEEHSKWVKKLMSIDTKFKSKVNISFLFDLNNRLDYKDSPIDKGKEIFEQLLKERIIV